MRIRAAARAYMIGMGLLVLAGISIISSEQWTHLSSLREARALVGVLEPAIRFVEVMALERGEYNQVLISKDIGVEQARHDVTEHNLVTDNVFRDTLERLSPLPPALQAQLETPLSQARGIVVEARARADKILQDPNVTSPQAAQDLVSSFVRAGALLDKMMVAIQSKLSERNPRLGLMLEISRLSNDMREAAGQRSTMLSRYAGTMQPLTPANAAKVSELTGQIAISWKRLERTASQLDHSPKIDAAVAATRSIFIDKGEPTYRLMIEAARSGSVPPMDLLLFRAWTVGMLGEILGVRDAPVQQAFDLLDEEQSSAALRLWWALGALGLAAAGALVAGLWVERRIVEPLTTLTRAIEHVTDCNEVSDLDGSASLRETDRLVKHDAERQDEIGSLARALDRFQQRTLELDQLNKRFDAALANLPQGLCFFNANHELVVCNSRYAEMYGLPLALAKAGTPIRSILEARIAMGVLEHSDKYIEDILAHTDKPRHFVSDLKDGRAIAVRQQPMPGGGWIATHEDITDRRKADEQIAYLAHHDALTGLANRVRLRQEMDKALALIDATTQVAVLCLDLDRFKAVNDTLGHSSGDALLKQVGRRLIDCVGDTDTVARLGGDEFAIVSAEFRDPDQASALAKRIIAQISAPFDLDGYQAMIGTSIGIAIGPGDGTDSEQLLKSADMALYRAKTDGRGTYRFFESEMDAWMQRRRALELDLRKALPNGELEIYYQPILALNTDRITAFEALLRWNHPTMGRIPPVDFIQLAEEINIIGDIGCWVLKRACEEAMTWPNDIKVSVNLSAIQFENRRIPLDVVAALGSSGLPAHRLEVEITEATMLQNTEAVVTALQQIRELGVKISMDDFGTGYSSLSYLRKFPFDKIKIDQCFIRDMDKDPNAASIIRAVIGLGAKLGMCTNAEGVETSEQLAHLRNEGCNEIQGYLLSAPIPAHEIGALLREYFGKWHVA